MTAYEMRISDWSSDVGSSDLWDLALMGLGLHLEDSTPVDPAEFETFTFSPEGIALVEHSASGWAEAAIADGDEPGPAREAAARTVTFYTVMPEEDPSA